jgi:hypothetical protein
VGWGGVGVAGSGQAQAAAGQPPVQSQLQEPTTALTMTRATAAEAHLGEQVQPQVHAPARAARVQLLPQLEALVQVRQERILSQLGAVACQPACASGCTHA